MRLDAAFDPRPASTLGLNSSEFFAQSFTVQASGMLTGLELLLFQTPEVGTSPAPLHVWVLPVVETQPSNDFGAALATGVILSDRLPYPDGFGTGPFTAVPLSNSVQVTAGQRLAIALRPDRSSLFWWGYGADNPYPAGDVHARIHCGPATGSACEWFTVKSEAFDMGFRTFLAADAAAVPEPATVLLVGTGMLAAWRARHRRDRPVKIS